MRAVLDTNVFVSYLLSSRARQITVNAVVDAVLAGTYYLLQPNELIGWIENKCKLSRVIDLGDARDFRAAVRSFSEFFPYPVLVPSHPRRQILLCLPLDTLIRRRCPRVDGPCNLLVLTG